MAKDKRSNMFVSGVFVLAVANILVKVIGLLYKIPLQNLIGDEGMGYFNAAYRIYTMFYMVSTAGLPVAVSIMISESRAKGNKKETKSIFKVAVGLFAVVGLVGTSIMFFGSKIIASVIKMDASYICIMAIAPTLFFICICSAIRGYFQGYQNMLPTAISEVMEALGKLVIGILFAKFAIARGYALPTVAAFTILGITIGVVSGTLYIIAQRLFFNYEKYDGEFFDLGENTKLRSRTQLVKALLSISIPITISSSVMSVADFFDVMIISRRLQSIGYSSEIAAAKYGNYTTLCVPLFNLPPILIYPISCSIVPYVSSTVAEGNLKKAREIMNRSLKIATMIAIPSALGLSVMSKPILSLLFKNEESVKNAAPLLSVLALSVFFLGMLSVTNAILQATKNERLPIISMAIGALVKLLSSIILIGIPGIEMFGAPIGTFLCYFSITLINFIFLAEKTGLIPEFKSVFIKPFISSVLCVLSAFGVYKLFYVVLGKGNLISTCSAIAVAVFVYLFAILLTKSVTKDDMEMLPMGEKIYSVLNKLKLM